MNILPLFVPPRPLLIFLKYFRYPPDLPLITKYYVGIMNKSCEFKVHFFSANPKYYMYEYVLLVYVKLFQNVGGDTIWDHLRGGHSCPIPLPKGGCYCPWPVHNLWYDWQWQIIIIHFGGCKWEFYHSQFRTDELRKILVILSWVSERSPSRVLGEDPWWPEKTLRPKKMEKFSS